LNKFLKHFFYKDNENEILNELNDWSKKFWKIDCKNAPAIFAQRGYEDKGHGHIDRIISNVGELLEKYCKILYRLNHTDAKEDFTDEFKIKFIDQLRPNLIMFYIAAHLHDIGMNYAGIYEALSDLVAAGGDNALHIGEIIHKYHHYSSFIVLLELNYLENIEQIKEDVDKSMKHRPYSLNLYQNDKKQKIDDLKRLKVVLKNIYEKHFKEQFENDIKSENDFFVMIAILCLLHKEVNSDYAQSIIRKFRNERQETVRLFNKWWDNLNRANNWTEKLKEILPKIKNSPNRFSGCDQILLMGNEISSDGSNKKNKLILDLLLAEALLQYGDKTEITIARVARKIEAEGKGDTHEYNPLEEFKKATEYDNQKGFICTDMAQSIISPFARFRACRFIPLILVEAQEEIRKEDGKIKIMEKLDVVFHYCRFDNDNSIFRILRYHNEKDFYDLGFLEVIRAHIPLLIDQFGETFKNNPILDILFKKMEHRLLSFEEELKRLLDYFLNTSKRQQNVIQVRIDSKETKENQPKVLETEPNNIVADFLNTEKLKGIIKWTVLSGDKNPAKDISNELHIELKKQFKNHLESLNKKIVYDKNINKKEKEMQSSTLRKVLKNLFKKYLEKVELEEIIQKSYENKESPEHLMTRIYFKFKKQLVYFLAGLKDSEPNSSVEESKTKLFIDKDDEFEKKINRFEDTQKGIEILRETIYKEVLGNINPEDRFPYTSQNRKAIVEYSKSILDPEEKKKTEGVKKVFYETGDLIVPSSFEVMTVLNLFYEEE